MKKAWKLCLRILLFLLAAWLTLSVLWFGWSRIAFSEYRDGMEENPFSTFLVRRYAVSDADYTYLVKFPDYLSSVGNLAVSAREDDAPVTAFLVWKTLFGKTTYGLILTDSGESYQIYTDAKGQPTDKTFEPLADKYRTEIDAIIHAAERVWSYPH